MTSLFANFSRRGKELGRIKFLISCELRHGRHDFATVPHGWKMMGKGWANTNKDSGSAGVTESPAAHGRKPLSTKRVPDHPRSAFHVALLAKCGGMGNEESP